MELFDILDRAVLLSFLQVWVTHLDIFQVCESIWIRPFIDRLTDLEQYRCTLNKNQIQG